MHKFFLICGLGLVAACGVPPEEDAAAKVGFTPSSGSEKMPVLREQLRQSQAWAALLQEYR